MKSRVVPCLLAAAAACAAALLLWALAVRFPGPLTRALSPVQVSPWEMRILLRRTMSRFRNN